MSLKKYLLTMSGLTLLLWIIFIWLINSINPETTNWFGFAFFYFSLFLSLSGTMALIGFLIRKRFSKTTLNFYLVKTSFRQSFIFSFLITTVLFMLAEHIFSWLNILILIIILSIIEYLLINKK